jgi:hypothetical protein
MHCDSLGGARSSPTPQLLITRQIPGLRRAASGKKGDEWAEIFGRLVGRSGHDGGSVLDQGQHEAPVDAWLKRSAKDDLPPAVLLQLFEAALGALWARTKTTLGEVTLTAIAERVLHDASEKFPLFSSLKVEPTGGIPFRELRERPNSVNVSELTAGIRFVLVEFLTVLGNLTADILTPELHAELSNVALPDTQGEPPKS